MRARQGFVGFLRIGLLVLSTAVCFGQCEEFELGFELEGAGGCGGVYFGAPGCFVEIEGFVTIDACREGVIGWVLAFGLDGEGDIVFNKGTITACSQACASEVVGVPVFFNSPVILDPEIVPEVGPRAGAPQGPGVMDGVLLGDASQGFGQMLGRGVSRLMRVRFSVEVPTTSQTYRLSFGDGFVGSVGLPIRMGIRLDDGGRADPIPGSCVFIVAPDPSIDRTCTRFRRGDANGDGVLDITDAINSLSFQFLGSFDPDCEDALDLDDNGAIEVTDPIRSLTFQFLGGPPPELPGKDTCGPDPTELDEDLTCEHYPEDRC